MPLTEKTQVNAVTNVHAGLKRKASDLDHESQPAYPAAEAETIIGPPVKKTALDHPGKTVVKCCFRIHKTIILEFYNFLARHPILRYHGVGNTLQLIEL